MARVQEGDRPLYVQVQDSLAHLITSGEWQPGMKLPSERDLSQQLSVSRVTVRQAIAALEEDGLLYRIHGKGTFVAKPKIELDARDLISFTSGMQRRGIVPSAKVLEFSRVPASRKVAAALQIEVGQQVYHIRRLRLGNNIPTVIEKCYFPYALCKGLERFDLSTASIYRVLHDELGVQLRHVRQTLEPVLATEEEAAILHVEPGFPLMLVTRVAYTDGEVPVEYGKALYRGDCSRFVSELHL
ncbi:MAG: GntR family transcriptional regulator [Anaerolineae bacterium]